MLGFIFMGGAFLALCVGALLRRQALVRDNVTGAAYQSYKILNGFTVLLFFASAMIYLYILA